MASEQSSHLLCVVHQPEKPDTNYYYCLSKNSEAACTGRPFFPTPQIINPHTIYCERADPIAKNLVDFEFAFLQDVSSIYSRLGACPLSIGGPNASANNGQNAAGLPFSVGQTL